jgi:hypothetical protein
MANYAYEKGKYGGPCGAIFPFFRQIQGNLPTEPDYDDFIPAGYLKCNGQILSADQFPQLADLLGIGDSCLYKKENITLANKNEGGTGGTFQLPDLGSKYITTASNPGVYSNDSTLNPTTNLTVQRAGVAVNISSAGDTVEFTYSGDFKSKGISALNFVGLWKTVSPPSKTPSTTIQSGNLIAHGHRGTHTITHSINQNNQGMATGSWAGAFYDGGILCYQPAKVVCTADANYGVTFVALDITESGSESSHTHPLSSVSLSTSYSGSIPSTTMTASGLTTTVNLKTKNTFKMDDIAPKFILCEYLIKY